MGTSNNPGQRLVRRQGRDPGGALSPHLNALGHSGSEIAYTLVSYLGGNLYHSFES